MKISRLHQLSAREAWQHEAQDFTPWLVENLDRIGEVIELHLEPEGREIAVGPFSADIVARDQRGRLVLIENQLEGTDHTHLGQIMTYLAGLEAEIVIWIATAFRDEHLSAINWLNEHTEENFAFFALQVGVVQIEDSTPAAVFDVLARPNTWDREVRRAIRQPTGEMAQYVKARKEFWDFYLSEYPEDAELGVQSNASSSQWIKTDRSNGFLVALYKSKNAVGVFLRGPRGETPAETQRRLAPKASEFAALAGSCRMLGVDTNHPQDSMSVDTMNPDNWREAVEWLHRRAHEYLTAVSEVFK